MIHLVNPLWNAYGGSERRTLALHEMLRPRADVLLWSEHRVHPGIQAPVRRIAGGDFPRGGTLVVVGVYHALGDWIAEAKPERAILVYNTFHPDALKQQLARLDAAGIRPELVYACELLRLSAGREGVVELSPIDLAEFSPGPPKPPGPRVVGRLSRDVAEKHHPDDLEIYRRLLASGVRVRIMGGTCLPELPGLERLPEGAEPAADFLRGLDVFFYRTSERWVEAFGRVVVEAQACGVPVVAHRRGGYVSLLEDDDLFATNEEAEALLRRLLEDPARRASKGASARRSVVAAYGPDWRERTAAYYLNRASR